MQGKVKTMVKKTHPKKMIDISDRLLYLNIFLPLHIPKATSKDTVLISHF